MADLSMFDLTDRVAIVTGGGHGISKAVALGFAQAGAHVAVVDKVPERAEATSAAIEDLGRESLYDTAHIGYEDKASEFVGRVLDKFGRVDILFNGAGGMRTSALHMKKHDLTLFLMTSSSTSSVSSSTGFS